MISGFWKGDGVVRGRVFKQEFWASWRGGDLGAHTRGRKMFIAKVEEWSSGVISALIMKVEGSSIERFKDEI